MQQHMHLDGASAGLPSGVDEHWARARVARIGAEGLPTRELTRELTMDRAGTRAREAATRATRRSKCGAVLVEFALIVFAFYLLFAGTFEMGRMVFSAQILQNAARVGARELALIPLPATYTFDKALGVNPPYTVLPAADQANVNSVRESVYDITLLAVDISSFLDEASFQAFVATWPPLNRMLLPLMIREQSGNATILRYPGALVDVPTFGSDSTGDTRIVMVPIVTSRGAEGAEVIEWHHVVEEMRASPNDPTTGPFSMIPSPPQTQQGLVALRVNFPFQAASMTAFQNAAPGDPIFNDPVLANDGAVTVDDDSIALPGSLVAGSPEGTYAGLYGLGKQYALSKEVRPFHRSLTAQSIFRREVFK